jgi:hypothetical protein
MSTDLARVFGGGESGLAYFPKTATARLDREPRTQLSDFEEDFVEQSLAAAWQSAQQKYGPDPAACNQRGREAVATGLPLAAMCAYVTLSEWKRLRRRAR